MKPGVAAEANSVPFNRDANVQHEALEGISFVVFDVPILTCGWGYPSSVCVGHGLVGQEVCVDPVRLPVHLVVDAGSQTFGASGAAGSMVASMTWCPKIAGSTLFLMAWKGKPRSIVC